MTLSASHLTRYRQIASLLWKYGRSDLAQQMSTEEGFGVDPAPPAENKPPAWPRPRTWRMISKRWVRPTSSW